jgi:hypothetical protein
MKRVHLLRMAVLTVLLLGATNARASLIQWGYDWNASPSFVTAGTGKVTLSNEPYRTAKGDSNVVASNLQVFSTAAPATPDEFGLSDGKYSTTVSLKDVASGKTGSLTFNGQMQGYFSQYNANITNAFTAPTTQTIRLGDAFFTVTMAYYTPPGPPAQGNLGGLGAVVSVKPVPEPGSMALATVGASLAGMAMLRWRRFRRRAATA